MIGWWAVGGGVRGFEAYRGARGTGGAGGHGPSSTTESVRGSAPSDVPSPGSAADGGFASTASPGDRLPAADRPPEGGHHDTRPLV